MPDITREELDKVARGIDDATDFFFERKHLAAFALRLVDELRELKAAYETDEVYWREKFSGRWSTAEHPDGELACMRAARAKDIEALRLVISVPPSWRPDGIGPSGYEVAKARLAAWEKDNAS